MCVCDFRISNNNIPTVSFLFLPWVVSYCMTQKVPGIPFPSITKLIFFSGTAGIIFLDVYLRVFYRVFTHLLTSSETTWITEKQRIVSEPEG